MGNHPPDSIQQKPMVVNNYNTTINYSSFITDFVVKKASIYLRNSDTTRCLGKIDIGSTVLILSEKPKWCYVEVIIEKYSSKGVKLGEKLVRGWVRKENLESFSKIK